MERSKRGAGLTYRPLTSPWRPGLELFTFAGAWTPPAERIEAGWGAWDEERLCGALLLERAGPDGMLHGPVVIAPADASPEVAIETAAELLADALAHAPAAGVETVFTRPQGLDQIWVRLGFIPVPEAELPAPLRGQPGIGLFGWRGGSALWTMARRGSSRPGALSAR